MNHKSEICDFCHIGEIVETRLTYTERFQEELILISNVPGRVCSYCGEKKFDPLVMGTLRRLLWTGIQGSGDKRSNMASYSYRINLQSSINKGQSPSGGN